MKRKKLKNLKRHGRRSGFRPKYNKKSVASRRIIRLQKLKENNNG